MNDRQFICITKLEKRKTLHFCNQLFKNCESSGTHCNCQRLVVMCYNSLLLALGVVSEVGLWDQLHDILL